MKKQNKNKQTNKQKKTKHASCPRYAKLHKINLATSHHFKTLFLAVT